MLLRVPGVLTSAQVEQFRARMEKARWVDGNVTSGHQSALAKYNEQLAEDSLTNSSHPFPPLFSDN